MRDIHAVIEDPNKGPIPVDCMWGVHSPGAVSATALVQFSGWSEQKAKAYWNQARNNAPCRKGGCDAWIDAKFSRFKVDPSPKIASEQQAQLCPK